MSSILCFEMRIVEQTLLLKIKDIFFHTLSSGKQHTMFGLRSLTRKTRRQNQYKQVQVKVKPKVHAYQPRSRRGTKSKKDLDTANPVDIADQKEAPMELSRSVVYLEKEGMRPHLPPDIREAVQDAIQMVEYENLLQVIEVEFIPSPLKKPKHYTLLRSILEPDKSGDPYKSYPQNGIHQLITLHGTPFVNIENIFKEGFNTQTVWCSQSPKVASYYSNSYPFVVLAEDVSSFIGCYTFTSKDNMICKNWFKDQSKLTFAVHHNKCIPFCVLRCRHIAKLSFPH
jgi:hypothetical protein